MSENITHTGSLDDCFRLMEASGEFCDAFVECARSHRDSARLGAITRSGDLFTVSLLTEFRQRWPTRTGTDRLDQKLAFVLGWLCHRAADREMKPVFRALEPGRPISPAETSVYNDAVIFHQVYNSGAEEPYHPAMWTEGLDSLPAASHLDIGAVEELFRVFLQRALLELHTLIPDREDIEGWLDRLFTLRQRFYVDRARYASAILHPDPEKLRRYIVEANFYDPEEAIIATARTLQRGTSLSPEQVRVAVSSEGRAQYGSILRCGYRYLKAANDYFSGALSPEELEEQLNIGQPGRDGLGV